MVINYIKIVGASILLSKWEHILSIEFEYKEVKSIMFTQFKRLLIGKPKRNRDLKMKESVISRL